MATDDILLPIKVVFSSEADFRPPSGTPRDFEPVCEVTNELRGSLAGQVLAVSKSFSRSFETWKDLPAVAEVTLRDEALAKSYRPSRIFNETTCPIIGGTGAGQLLISVSSEGLGKVEHALRENRGKKVTAHISVLKSIAPFSADVSRSVQKDKTGKEDSLRVRLFRHASETTNQALRNAFIALAKQSGAPSVEELDYAPGICIYRVNGLPQENFESITAFVGTQSVSPFPDYDVVRTSSTAIRTITPDLFPPPDPHVQYGLVGIIDSGTDPTNPYLQNWVLARDDKYVPRALQNNDHGSFVAGLLSNGRLLNHGDPRFPAAAARIVDVVAFGRGALKEDQLLHIIDHALTTYPQVRVWNLSLSLKYVTCGDGKVSEIGAALDERSRRHNVLFVVAAGNYAAKPFRTWPSQGGLGEADRMHPPADSVRCIAVGGVAHLDTASTVVKRHHPSPFSRRGPGAIGMLKPELGHYAGNCDRDGKYLQTGVISLNGSGHIAEDIGTSFACPLVSAIAANVHRELDVPAGTASVTLAKAMTIHSAFLRNSGPLDANEIKYFGIGCPGDVEEIVSCRQSEATIVLQVDVPTNDVFEKRDFPMPRCLINERGLACSIFMTLLYDCPVDRQFDLEYCRNTVTASLGTLSIDDEGKESYSRQVPGAPEKMHQQHAPDIYKHGYAWSPLKLYYRNFQRGPDKPWRLTLESTARAEHVASVQPVVLLITIRSRNVNDQVYNELVQSINRLGWDMADLQVQSRIRERSR